MMGWWGGKANAEKWKEEEKRMNKGKEERGREVDE